MPVTPATPTFRPAEPMDRSAAIPCDVSDALGGTTLLRVVLSCPATMSVLGIVFGCFFACGLIVGGWSFAVAAPDFTTFLCGAFFMLGGNLLGRLLGATLNPGGGRQ